MAVRASSGEKVSNVVMREQAEEDWDTLEGFAYEINHRFSFNRSVNGVEAKSLIDGFFMKWRVEHPHEELKYMEIRKLSTAEARASRLSSPAYETTIQVEHHSPSITVGAVVAAVAVVLAFVAANALEIAITAALVMGIYSMWRLTNYFLPEEETYKCPKDGEEFESYDNFKIHFETMHPDQDVPPKPRDWTDYLKYVVIGIGGALAFRIVYPAFRGE